MRVNNQEPPVCGRVVIAETEAAWLTGPRYFIAIDLFNCYVCTPLHPRSALTPGFGRSRGSRGVVETCYSTAGNRVMQKIIITNPEDIDQTGLIAWITFLIICRVSQKECARLREGVPYVKVYRYNPKHLCPNLNGYGDNGQRSFKLWQLLHTYWLPNTY